VASDIHARQQLREDVGEAFQIGRFSDRTSGEGEICEQVIELAFGKLGELSSPAAG
jgi:hypothetical protein